jgi:hypothetical protein
MKEVISKIQDTNLEELDVWLGFLPGCDYLGLRSGQKAITSKNQHVTILGFSSTYIKDQRVEKASKNEI